jgi:hypothetical protein
LPTPHDRPPGRVTSSAGHPLGDRFAKAQAWFRADLAKYSKQLGTGNAANPDLAVSPLEHIKGQ